MMHDGLQQLANLDYRVRVWSGTIFGCGRQGTTLVLEHACGFDIGDPASTIRRVRYIVDRKKNGMYENP